MALADLDGDGDLDVVLANRAGSMPHASRVLFNVGDGRFRDSGQELNVIPNKTVLLHDFDDDGDVDVLFENHAFGDYRVVTLGNDGNGRLQWLWPWWLWVAGLAVGLGVIAWITIRRRASSSAFG